MIIFEFTYSNLSHWSENGRGIDYFEISDTVASKRSYTDLPETSSRQLPMGSSSDWYLSGYADPRKGTFPRL